MELIKEVENAAHPSQAELDTDWAGLGFSQAQGLNSDRLMKLLQTNPEDSRLTYQLGVRLVKEGRYSAAESVLRSLIKRENCFEVLEALARCLYHLEQWVDCAHFARHALMMGEGFRDQRFDLLKNLGNSLLQLKDIDGAQEAYEKAFALFPGSDVLQVNFGTLWIQRNDWNLATECFRQALFLNFRNDRAWVGLGLCHRVRGDHELSFANVERALDEGPANETALALILEWSRDFGEFRRASERFIEFADAGGFSESLSRLFVARAKSFGRADLAQWEEFHLKVRGFETNA